MKECLICKEEKPSVVARFNCNHCFCRDCAFEYLRLKITENNIETMPCPFYNCPYNITDDEILGVVDCELFEKYRAFQRTMRLSMNPNLRFCPKPDCSGYAIGSSAQHILECNDCQLQYCYYCNEEWHEGISCKNSIDFKFDRWSLDHDIKHCPNCKRRIEKAGGCPAMECPVCKAKWCWYCGKDLTSGHDPILCVFTNDSWDLKYWFIFFLMLGPLTMPFGIGMLLIHLSQNYLTDSDKESKVILNLIRLKWISYPLVLLLSPIFSVILLLGSGFFVIYINKGAFKPYGSGCHSKFFKHKCLRYTIMFILGCIVTGVLTSILLIVVVSTPLVGVCFLLGKLYTDIKRMKHERNEESKGYVKF